MAAKDPNRLFDLLDAMKESMESLIEDAQTLVQESASFTGEISKVMKQQLVNYFIPGMQKMITDPNTPGSIFGLQRFLGSVPLAMTREKPEGEDPLEGIAPQDVKLVVPAEEESVNPVDNLPKGASYRKGTEGMPESKKTKKSSLKKMKESANAPKSRRAVQLKEEDSEVGKWQVVRCSKKASDLDEEQSKLKDTVVYEFNTQEEAERKAEYLNETVEPYEKSLFGTEYKVVALKPNKKNLKESKTDSTEMTKIKDWYMKTFPEDEVGKTLNDDVTFLDLFDCLDHYHDVYDCLGGDADSVVRERVFTELAKIMDVDYDYVYDQWMKAEDR